MSVIAPSSPTVKSPESIPSTPSTPDTPQYNPSADNEPTEPSLLKRTHSSTIGLIAGNAGNVPYMHRASSFPLISSKRVKREGIPPAPKPAQAVVTFTEKDINKMCKNSSKTLPEHREALGKENSRRVQNDQERLPDSFIAVEELGAAALINTPRLDRPLKIAQTSITDIGIQKPSEIKIKKMHANEDRHLVIETEDYILGCIFDGFGGNDTSKFVQKYFAKNFKSEFDANKGNFKQTVEVMFNDIQHIIKTFEDKAFLMAGTTACLNIIDKHTGLLFVCTLGDSETYAYKKGLEKATPESCVRDWASKKDFDRAIKGNFNMNDSICWKGQWSQSKFYRVDNTNVSRALGMTITESRLQKGKFTIDRMESGSIIINACDGLWDYLQQQEIIQIVNEHRDDLELMTKELVKKAKEKMIIKNGGDNITIIAFRIE